MAAFRGNPEVKEKLAELIEVVRDPERYTRLGANPPKGVLLCGETGTGKTFAARAIASEAGVPFLCISGSEFRQSPYSGVGTSMALKMFTQAQKHAPCIILIDEIDSLGEARRQTPSGMLEPDQQGSTAR